MTQSIEPMLGLMFFAEEADEGSFNPILPTLPEMIWSGLFFFGLWALMKFVLLPPIIEGRDQRRASVNAGQDSVSDSESELAQIRAAHQQRIAAAQAEASTILDEARNAADQQRAEAAAAVEDQIAKLRAATQAEINTARAQALAGARGSVSSVATGAAGKVLGRSLDGGTNQSTIDAYLDKGS